MITIDTRRHEVKVKGREVHLTPKEFQIIKFLIEKKGYLVTRLELLESFWGSKEIELRTIDQHMARIRIKLGRGCPVKTITGYGYKAVDGKIL